MTNSFRISKATRYQNAAINYYLSLTNSPFLHYGYWEPLPAPQEELTIGKLRLAQQAYADKLLSFMPEGIKTILDVGCGVGGNAAYLLDQSFVVEGLAPDHYQQEQFLKHTQGQAVFHLSRLETFQSNSPYDLMLLSESSQYIATADIARCAAALIKPNGYLLLADMLRTNADYTKGIFSNCHLIGDLEQALQQAGFTMLKTEDISRNILPTIDLCVENFRKFGLSTSFYVADLLAIAAPPIYKLLSWACSRYLQPLVSEGLAARHIFEQHLCYQVQLWQLQEKTN